MALREAIEVIARAALSDLIYVKRYAARVERDNGDGTVDVAPEDAALRGSLGLQRIKVRVGVAGAAARIEPGARCLIGFEDGLPSKPYVSEWSYAQRSATISLDGGVAAVARKGDLIDVMLSGGPAGTPVSGSATGTITIPGSPPTIVPVPPGTPFIGTLIAADPVRAVIIGGAARVKA